MFRRGPAMTVSGRRVPYGAAEFPHVPPQSIPNMPQGKPAVCRIFSLRGFLPAYARFFNVSSHEYSSVLTLGLMRQT